MKRLNIKYGIIFVILFFASIRTDVYKDFVLNTLKDILNSSNLYYFLTVFVFLIVVVHKIRYNEFSGKSLTDPKKIKELMTDIISSITDPSTFICSVSILKGLYLDFFFKESFFFNFNSSEKVFLLISSFYFLVHSFIELKKSFLEIFLNTESITLDTN